MLKKLLIISLSLSFSAYYLKQGEEYSILTQSLYALSFLLASFYITKIKKIDIHTWDITIILWVGWLLAGLVYSNNNGASFDFLKFVFLTLSLIYLARITFKADEDITLFFQCICIIVIFMVVRDLWTGYEFGSFYRYKFSKITAVAVSTMYGYSLLVSIGLLSNSEYKYKWLAYFSLAASIVGMALSTTKGPLLVSAAIIIFRFVFRRGKRMDFKQQAAILAISLTVLILGYDLFQPLLERILNSSQDQSTIERLDLIQQAVDYFQKNPLLGAGTSGIEYYPHDIVLEMLSENGLIGATLGVIVILIPLLIKQVRQGKLDGVIFNLYLYSVFESLISWSYFFNKFLFLSLGLLYLYKRQDYYFTEAEASESGIKMLSDSNGVKV